MIARSLSSSPCHAPFLVMLPSIRNYARFAFRHLRDEEREDAIQEIIANAYVAFVRLVARGKAAVAHPGILARYAWWQFRSGRRVGSSSNVAEVCSTTAKRRHGYRVERLDQRNEAGEWFEAVVEDTATPVPEQAAFRCDFPAWLGTQSPRNRRIAEALSLGHATSEVARQFGVTDARVSQLRSEFCASWRAFHERGSEAAVAC